MAISGFPTLIGPLSGGKRSNKGSKKSHRSHKTKKTKKSKKTKGGCGCRW